MKRSKLILAVALVIQAASQTLLADSTADQIEALKKQIEQLTEKVTALEQQAAAAKAQQSPVATTDPRIEQLDQKVRILERKQELDQEAEVAKAKATPVISAGADGFSFRSADTNFVLALHSVLQVDSRTFFNDGGIKGNDSFILRRARPILQGTLYRDFDFLFIPDFGGTSGAQIYDAYLNYRYGPELQLQGGKFKSPVGLEHLQADVNTSFNERSLATDLVPNRDLGFELHGDLADRVVSYAAGIFNGAPDYSTPTANANYQDNKAFVGRLFLQPFRKSSLAALKGFGFGLGNSYEVDRAATNTASTGLTSGYTTDGQQKFFSYTPANETFSPMERTGDFRPKVIITTGRSVCLGNM